MKVKSDDVLYCGCDINKIKHAHPTFDEDAIELFHHMITERYMIHLRKDVDKLDPPWTEDPYLLQYRFTNVRREHDKTSRWLIDNISNNQQFEYPERVYLSILFRLYNRIETAELLKLYDRESVYRILYPDGSKDYARILLKSAPDGFRYTTNAYKVGGTTVGLKSQFPNEPDKCMLPVRLIRKLIDEDLYSTLCSARNQEDVFNILWGVKGLGRFIAYQVFVDLTYIDEFPFSENEFVVSGPGCNYGMRFLFKSWDGLTDEELLFWLRDHIDEEFYARGFDWNPEELFRDLDESDRYMNVMSLENCMCEFSKYYVCQRDTGRRCKMPRHYYY